LSPVLDPAAPRPRDRAMRLVDRDQTVVAVPIESPNQRLYGGDLHLLWSLRVTGGDDTMRNRKAAKPVGATLHTLGASERNAARIGWGTRIRSTHPLMP